MGFHRTYNADKLTLSMVFTYGHVFSFPTMGNAIESIHIQFDGKDKKLI